MTNTTALPLEDNMFEWHCNMLLYGVYYHLIICFPDKYPYESPSAEICPHGFVYPGCASRDGKRGKKICVQIFSNYSEIHGN